MPVNVNEALYDVENVWIDYFRTVGYVDINHPTSSPYKDRLGEVIEKFEQLLGHAIKTLTLPLEHRVHELGTVFYNPATHFFVSVVAGDANAVKMLERKFKIALSTQVDDQLYLLLCDK